MSSHYVESSRLDYQSSGSVVRLLSGVLGGLVSCFIWKAFSCCVFFLSWVASGFLSRIGLCFFFVLWIPLPQPGLCGVLVIPSVFCLFFLEIWLVPKSCSSDFWFYLIFILNDLPRVFVAINTTDWRFLRCWCWHRGSCRSSVLEGSAILTLRENRGLSFTKKWWLSWPFCQRYICLMCRG